jgi:hypothetical protein
MFEKLKTKWGIESNWQVLAILIVFTVAGPTVLLIKGWYYDLLAFDENTSQFTKTIAYLLFIFPAYQALLLIYGFMLGQFRFFWEKEKAMVRAIAKMMGRGKSSKKQASN